MVKKSNRESISEMHHHGICADRREIFLIPNNGEVDDPGVDYRLASTFLKNIRYLDTYSNELIIIHQYSIGGGWLEGMMIYDAIKACKSPTVIITHGSAASMGSIIPQAANLRISTSSCWWFLHLGKTCLDPTLSLKQSKSWAKWEDDITTQMIDLYIDKLKFSVACEGKTEKAIANYLKKKFDNLDDWWMTAKDAVEHNLCDGILGIKPHSTYEEIRNVF